jgi:hypothetical protein
MSNTSGRSADEQCAEYVQKQRAKLRRAQADESLELHLAKMTRQYGLALTMGALFRYVGLLVLEGSHSVMVRQCRRFLAKCIARSIVRGVLTRRPVLHYH